MTPPHKRSPHEWPKVFEPVDGLKTALMIKSAVALFGPLLFLSWVIAVCLPFTNDLSDSWFISLVVLGLIWAAALWWRSRQLNGELNAMSLRVDAEGITQETKTHTRFVAWGDLREVRAVKPYGGVTVGQLGKSDGVKTSKRQRIYVLANAVFGTEFGLVGRGVSTVSDRLNAQQRGRLEHNIRADSVDDETGKPLLALYPQQFQLDWANDGIGMWLEHYRPDLHRQAQETLKQRKAA